MVGFGLIMLVVKLCSYINLQIQLSLLWSYGSWIYNYLYNQWLSPLTLGVRIPRTVYSIQHYVITFVSRSVVFSGHMQFSTNKTDRHAITDILLKVALNTMPLSISLQFNCHIIWRIFWMVNCRISVLSVKLNSNIANKARTTHLSNLKKVQSWPWSYGSWIYNYLCNQCLSPLMLWVRISIRTRCTTLWDKVCQWLATGQWFSPGLLPIKVTAMI